MPDDRTLFNLSRSRAANALPQNGGDVINNVRSAFSSDRAQSVINQAAAGERKAAINVLLGGEVDTLASDWRVRVSCAINANYLYRDPLNAILLPLRATNGVVFPYTPRVTMSYNANYDSTAVTHSNYPIHTYKNSGVSTISISGDFTAQTPVEARYMLAAMTFFRASTKMFWGKEPEAGQPPPVLYLNGYGKHFLPNVPVVITSYTTDLPDDIDYVEAYVADPQSVNGNITAVQTERSMSRLPAASTMTITCEPVYSRRKVHEEFTFRDFASGNLLGGRGRGGGGFV